MRESCHTDLLSDTSLIFPASHVVSFLSLTITSRYVNTLPILPPCVRLILLSIVHPTENRNFRAYLLELGGKSSSSSSSSFLSLVFIVLGRKIYVNESSLCKGNLEQFYHIKQSIVFVLFYLFNFAYSSSVCCWFFFFSLRSLAVKFNLIFSDSRTTHKMNSGDENVRNIVWFKFEMRHLKVHSEEMLWHLTKRYNE